MSDPIDQQALDEYLNRGSAVSRQYRELDALDVPADLDRRVLDEARAAVAPATRTSRRWLRWSAPVALAASMVLVLSIVVRSGVQQTTLSPAAPVTFELRAPTKADAARQEAMAAEQKRRRASESSAPSAAAESTPSQFVPIVPIVPIEPPSLAVEVPYEPYLMRERDTTAAATQERPVAATAPENAASKAAPQAAAAAPAPQSHAAAGEELATAVVTAQSGPHEPASGLSGMAGNGSRAARTRAEAGPRGSIAPARAQPRAQSAETITEAAVEEPSRTDPVRWLEEIRALRKDGNNELADREWTRFREAFPNHPVAAGDLARGQPTQQSRAPHNR